MVKISVALRFDDPSPVSNWSLERDILKLLSKHGVPVTAAVVPFRVLDGKTLELKPGMLQHLEDAKESGLLEVALHGCFHKQSAVDWVRRPSEFYGIDAKLQLELLGQGLKKIEEVFGGGIRGFVPPWNSYDSDTVAAVARLGLSYISASWDTPPGELSGITLIPKTCRLTDLKFAVERTRRYRVLRPVIVVVFHQYDFYESGDPEGRIGLKPQLG